MAGFQKFSIIDLPSEKEVSMSLFGKSDQRVKVEFEIAANGGTSRTLTAHINNIQRLNGSAIFSFKGRGVINNKGPTLPIHGKFSPFLLKEEKNYGEVEVKYKTNKKPRTRKKRFYHK